MAPLPQARAEAERAEERAEADRAAAEVAAAVERAEREATKRAAADQAPAPPISPSTKSRGLVAMLARKYGLSHLLPGEYEWKG